MTAEIGDLPHDIHREFKKYLSRDDYQQLLWTSKKFRMIQKKTAYYSLTNEKSILFCQDERFRQFVLSKVENPSLQISLSLSPKMVWDYSHSHLLSVSRLTCNHKDNEEDAFDTFPLIPGLKKSVSLRGLRLLSNIANLSSIEHIDLNECNELKDISPLAQVPNVSINGCSKIQDFSCLKNQKNLYISKQYHFNDLSAFRMVQSLSLFDCRGLPADLSPLKGIPRLFLFCCTEINDISQLGNHKYLSICKCSPHISGYDILLHIPKVALTGCDISDITVLRSAQKVTLQSCHCVTDISSLANVKVLQISNCDGVTDINPLSNVKHLTLGLLPALVWAEGLTHHRSLEIQCNGYGITSDLNLFLKKFPSTKSLTLIEVPTSLLSVVSQLSFLQHLSIHLIFEDFKLTGCERINHVSVQHCPALTSLEGLGRNREVHLVSLDLVSDVSVLADVPIVFIERCENIKDTSCLSKVPRLKVISKAL